MRPGRASSLVALILTIFLVSPVTDAQQAGKVHRIGWLDSTSLGRNIGTFQQALRDLGWVEGHNLVIEYRGAEARYERLADVAAALAGLPVDVIVAPDTASAMAAKKATKAIPIVMARVGDAVGSGLVASLARPGGNVTGLTNMLPELIGKQLELLTEAVPRISRVALLWEPANPDNPPLYKEVKVAARVLGVTVRSLEVRQHNDIEPAFSAMAREQADALIVLESLITAHPRIADLALKNRIPMASNSYELTGWGGLMSYVPSLSWTFTRAAMYVDRILKGATPGDLPVEQPTEFELIINMKTARTLGLRIPPSILIRADRVIE